MNTTETTPDRFCLPDDEVRDLQGRDAESLLALQTRQLMQVTTLALVGAAAIAALSTARTREGAPPSPEAYGSNPPLFRLDPNEAAWFELAQLPGVGERVARQIVDIRRQPTSRPRGNAYRGGSDLLDIPGIGPRNLLRIGQFLRFPPDERAAPP